MPSWPKETKYLSHSTQRLDGPAKVTGSAHYSSDIQADGWLYGMILRSKWPAAKVTSINLEKALKVPGIKAAILVREGERTIHFYGEELAAVAGTTKQACLDALLAIEVEAAPLKFVVKEDEARKEDAPKVWEGASNVSNPKVTEKGDVDKAFADCAAVVEGFFTTPVQVHNAMETHGSTASWTDEGLTSWSSTQGINSVRNELASNLKLDQSKVQVLCDYMGGGFGAKLGGVMENALAARLSQAAKAPVRLMLTRFDEALAVGNRPSSFQKIKLGADKDGKLQAYELDSYGTAGIGAGRATEAGGGGADFPAPYIYVIPNIRVKHIGVAVNAGGARAFRAPGHPPASFGMECIMDELAVKMGMDPVEFRLKNDTNESSGSGSIYRQREYKLGAERFGWKDKYRKPGSSPGPVKVGVGCAGATWGGGGSNRTRAEAQINPDGSVEVHCGVQDIGTGTRTVIAMVAAETLGLKLEQVTVKIGDTRFPYGPGSGGSTTCASVSPTVFDACTKAIEALKKQTEMTDVSGDNWFAACKKLGLNPLTVGGEFQPGLSSRGVGGVQFAEVAVDTETGLVTVKRILCVQDCGLVVNLLTAETQVQGGVIMGIGYALYEERIMDDLSGVVLNPNFETYKLPGIADVPEIEVILVTDSDVRDRGVIGLGEPVTIPTAGAIANAVANALGVRVPSIPITPARVLAALGKVKPASA